MCQDEENIALFAIVSSVPSTTHATGSAFLNEGLKSSQWMNDSCKMLFLPSHTGSFLVVLPKSMSGFFFFLTW